ncbi:MAG: hypothetical protein A2Y03_00640 [Omnitrophica WOR_2 bacterium GWF2_38_59]|nr:MAG: hypothetical protein A2Y03_00640 [Omnitrophica WOR_2 bacterium GWF2_38_59]OGX49515.1 MAG: hypothetical protein A2243_10565 [Omnitrophica WOR_2 bacterium RIFOXYA2_FULL_38_17]OGX58711.1 MAG: hypothetical protein A2306_12190 [Omnitrophica WOR_2 bacterium RIFOXYB2_FULL_38_16]
MIIYAHVTNHFRSVRKAWRLYESFTLVNAYRQNKGTRSKYYKQSDSLVDRREFFDQIFKDRQETRSEAPEKKVLRCNRNTAIILTLTKGAVL